MKREDYDYCLDISDNSKNVRKINVDKYNRRRAVMLLFLCSFIASVVAVIYFYRQDRKQEIQFEELAKLEEQDRDNISYDGKGSAAPFLPLIDNPDCIGWIKIEDTTVSYPIMQHEGDGEYYLHKDYNGEYSFYGTPFLDIRCTAESDNCIVYGHNINSHKMFGALHAYSDHDYCKEHPNIRIRFGDYMYTYHITAVVPTTTSDKLYNFTDISNRNEYAEYLELLVKEASYETDMIKMIKKELSDTTSKELFKKYRFLTLSTCRTWVGRDARLLIIAVRD